MFAAQVADDRAPDRPQVAWNAVPRGRRRVIINGTESDFQIADLIEFNHLKPRISNRQRITGHGVPRPEMVVWRERLATRRRNSPASAPTLPRTVRV